LVYAKAEKRRKIMLTELVSLLFFAVGAAILASGTYALQCNHKAQTNRVFFAIAIEIVIWSAGMALSNIAIDAATSEIFRRIASIGWGTAFASILHFILIITGKFSPPKKWRLYLFIYLPALFNVFLFAVPNKLNPHPYNLRQIKYGWVNAPENNIWDWIFYVYYIGYTLLGLTLLYQWGKKSSDIIIKKKSRIIIISILLTVIFGTITDVVLTSLYSDLPQMAPVVMLIPAIAIYHILQKDNLNISERINKKTSYIILFSCVLIYIILAAFQMYPTNSLFAIISSVLDILVIRGIIVQIQMLISVFLILKENRPGYVSAVILNFTGLLSSVACLIRYKSIISLSDIASYLGILVIIALIMLYKEKNAAYINMINTQAVREEFYFNVFKQAPVGIAIFSDTKFAKNDVFDDISINPEFEKILGRTKEELKKISWTNITHPDDLADDLEYLDKFKKGEIDSYSREKRYMKPDGSAVWVNMLISRFVGADKKSGDHVCIISDITSRKEIEATLKYNSEHVLLTELYNRSVLEKVLTGDASLPSSNKRALVCVNLFAMHALSARYGYYYNQTMIKNIADSLKAFCNDNYLLFDISEYRFVFYVKSYEDEKELTSFSEKVLDTLSSYLYVHGIKYTIGILQIDKLSAHNAEELLKMVISTSEAAANKNHGSSNILYYSPEQDLQIIRENDISREIREIAEGIKTERLFLQYQPILDVATNMICGFEALARINSEKYGLILPVEFVQIAEKTNMIVPFGEKIIIRALQFLNKLKENGYDDISVSINISTIQMLDDGFADRLLSKIREMRINPENVGIELTESVFATENEEINIVIDTLKAAGIKVLIDDFGTGYSSFARESELNIDCLKIDKCFIDKLMVLSPEEAITGDIISMAHKQEHYVVAEGVELEKQLNYLRDHGCDRIQGFLISKPLDEKDAIEFLVKRKEI